MRFSLFGTFLVIAMALGLAGCTAAAPTQPATEPEPVQTGGEGTGLFAATDQTGPEDNSPQISRSRFVTLNLALLLTEEGTPLPLEPGSRIPLNLFPDLSYTGILSQILEDENGISWIGTLEGVEYSEMTMVYTGEAFIAHIASPQGVYEVSSLGDGLYRVIQIDQNQLPGGEG